MDLINTLTNQAPSLDYAGFAPDNDKVSNVSHNLFVIMDDDFPWVSPLRRCACAGFGDGCCWMRSVLGPLPNGSRV